MTFLPCLQLPNAGDDLQAIKKGIVEIADVVVINKADIDPGQPAVTAPSGRTPCTGCVRLHPTGRLR